MAKGKFRPRITGDSKLDRTMSDAYVAINSLYDELSTAIANVSSSSSSSSIARPIATTKTVGKNIKYSDFPLNESVLAVESGFKLKKIYLELVTSFNVGSINIEDSDKTYLDYSILIDTEKNPQEYLILKTYTASDNLMLTSTGTPTVGEFNLVIEYIGV